MRKKLHFQHRLSQQFFQAPQSCDLEEAGRAGRIDEKFGKACIQVGKIYWAILGWYARTEISVRFPELQSQEEG